MSQATRHLDRHVVITRYQQDGQSQAFEDEFDRAICRRIVLHDIAREGDGVGWEKMPLCMRQAGLQARQRERTAELPCWVGQQMRVRELDEAYATIRHAASIADPLRISGGLMSNRSIPLTDSLYDYLLSVSLRESPFLLQLREETAALPTRSMQIAPEQGQFMGLLLRIMGARLCLEVGVYTGYSSLAAALALPDDGRIVACDVSEEWTSIARRYWRAAGVEHKIDLRLAPAVQTLDGLVAAGRRVATTLRSSTRTRQSYLAYYERVLLLLRTGGLILVDNTLWSGRVADPEYRRRGHRCIAAFQRSPASGYAYRLEPGTHRRRAHAGAQTVGKNGRPKAAAGRLDCRAGQYL